MRSFTKWNHSSKFLDNWTFIIESEKQLNDDISDQLLSSLMAIFEGHTQWNTQINEAFPAIPRRKILRKNYLEITDSL